MFLTKLQHKLQIEFDLKALSAHACCLSADGLPLNIIYYYLNSYGNRISLASDTRCIHVDEDIWMLKPHLLLNRIAAISGQAQRIHARDTVVARIDKPVALTFQQEHHLQVALPGKYRYGLFYEGDLVAVAIFSGGRKMDNQPDEYRSFELLRFCHKQGLQVVGGFSKLLDSFEQEFEPGDIMTYADKDWSDGSVYRKVGFTIVGETAPQLFWINQYTMKRYYDSHLPAEVNGKTPHELQESGYIPLHNSGSIKLVKKIL